MTHFDPRELGPAERYRFMVGCIVPRPIAWVSTISVDGQVNLAPFSFFTGITSSPPTLGFSIGYRKVPKDTLVNLRTQGEAVIHLPAPEQIDAVHQCGAEYKADISELDEIGMPSLPSELVAPPRLVDVPIALECRLSTEVPVGEPAASLCLLEVLHAHIADSVAQENGLPDPDLLRTLSRLGERSYLADTDWTLANRGKPEIEENKQR